MGFVRVKSMVGQYMIQKYCEGRVQGSHREQICVLSIIKLAKEELVP